MGKLTKSTIEKIQLPVARDALYWDEQLRGFGLRVTPATAKSPHGNKNFIVQARIGSGRAAASARVTIGSYGEFTPDEARDRARELLRDMRNGIDPRTAAQRTTAKRRTLREVADDYMRDRPLKPRSKDGIKEILVGPLKEWSETPLANITRANVLEAYLKMRARAPIYANRTFATLRAMFNYAAHEYVEKDGSPIFKDNPCNALYKKWTPPRASTSRIPDDKLNAVWEYLRTARANAHQSLTLAAIDVCTFLMLTGARLGEACALTWDRVNLNEAWFHLPDPKNSNSVWLPLSAQAVELLGKRPTREGYVFPTARGHIKDPRQTMANISKVAGEELSPHDLRRTFSNTGVRLCGIDLWKVELLTNHIPKSVTTRHYMETSKLQYLRPEVQQIADRIVG